MEKIQNYYAHELTPVNEYSFPPGIEVYLANDVAVLIQSAVEKERKACAKLIPTNWRDSLLSGPTKVILKSPCQEVEALLLAIADRIRQRRPPIGE